MMIIGFVIGGRGADELLCRAVGPSLRMFGVTGALDRPTLELGPLHDGALINTGWRNSSDKADISAASALVGTFPLAAEGADSAAIVSLHPSAYAMKVYGVGESTGIALAEIYEVP
jgi:hypothetical protein